MFTFKKSPATPPVEPQLQLKENVRRLLDFSVSQAVVKIDLPEIQKVMATLSAPLPLSVDEESGLWDAYNKLASLIHPATSEGVKAIYEMKEDIRARPGFLRAWCRDPLARREIFWSILWVILTLFPLIAFQCYSLGLSSFIENIVKTEASLAITQEDIARIQRTQADAGNDIPSLTIEFDALEARRIEDETSVNASYAMLLRSTAFWADLVLGDAAVKSSSDTARQQQINIRNASLALLNAVSLYILPLLYGLLGANVYILRQLLNKLDNWTLDLLSQSKHHLRRVLGVLLGAIIGLLFESEATAIASTGFGLATLAFLGGYSAELIFSLLDSAINRVKDAFAHKPSYEPKDASDKSGKDGHKEDKPAGA